MLLSVHIRNTMFYVFSQLSTKTDKPIFAPSLFVTIRKRVRINQSLNKSSIVTSLCIMPDCALCAMPQVVTIVRCNAFDEPVVRRKSSRLSVRCRRYCGVISYLPIENFISQRLIVWSLRSITRSICPPSCLIPSESTLEAVCHEHILHCIPLMPRACLIWRI